MHPCWKAHPGICADRDRDFLKPLLQAAARIRQASAAGQWYQVTAERVGGGTDEYYVFCSFARMRDPAICLYTHAWVYAAGARTILSLVVRSTGRLAVWSHWKVAKKCFGEGAQARALLSICMKRLNVHSIANSPLSVEVVDIAGGPICIHDKSKKPTSVLAPDGATAADLDLLSQMADMYAVGMCSGDKKDDAAPASEDESTVVPADNDIVERTEELGGESDDSDDDDESDADLDRILMPFPPGPTVLPTVPEPQMPPEIDVPPLPPPPDAPKEPQPPHRRHTYWWLSRSGRSASCMGCKNNIAAHQFRLIFEPNPLEVENAKKWKQVFWTYFHIDCSCLKHSRLWKPGDPLGIEVAYLPARFKETQEQYKRSVDENEIAALSAFRTAAATCGSVSGSASSTA